MTIQTYCFKRDKENGLVVKAGKASFMDGLCYKERVLWLDIADMTFYVMLDGNALRFKARNEMQADEYGVIRGRIH